MSHKNSKRQCREAEEEEEEEGNNEPMVDGKDAQQMTALEQKIDAFTKQWQKEVAELKAKNQTLTEQNEAFRKKMKEAEQKAQLEKDELKETIQMNRARMESLADEMAILKQQMRPDILWTHLIKGKKFVPPNGNRWTCTNAEITLSQDGLKASRENDGKKWLLVYADKGFDSSVEQCRKDNFPGTIVHYFEITKMSSTNSFPNFQFGLSKGNIPDGCKFVGDSPNCYSMADGCSGVYGCNVCSFAGKSRLFTRLPDAIKPTMNGNGDVFGCGLLLMPDNGWAIFFTANGILLGKQMAIENIPVDTQLYPFVNMWATVSVEANFGDDLASRPFTYDINTCPEMVFELN